MAKKDFWLLIDSWVCNKITNKYRYPLPFTPSVLEQLHGGQIFTSDVLTTSFGYVRGMSAQRHISHPPVTTSTSSCYGLINGHFIFQGYMNIFCIYVYSTWRFSRITSTALCLLYIDDNLVYYWNKAEHHQHISEVLRLLREHHLHLGKVHVSPDIHPVPRVSVQCHSHPNGQEEGWSKTFHHH